MLMATVNVTYPFQAVLVHLKPYRYSHLPFCCVTDFQGWDGLLLHGEEPLGAFR